MATIDQRIYTQALSDGMPAALALLIVAQSKHESNNYTSPVFTDCNNSFGYSSVYSPCSGHSGYESYGSVEQSTSDLTAWINRRLDAGTFPDLSTITDPTQYATLLYNNGYYTDSITDYANGLINWFDANVQAVGIGLGTLAIIGIGIYFIVRGKKRRSR
jgi:hypothetical protein